MTTAYCPLDSSSRIAYRSVEQTFPGRKTMQRANERVWPPMWAMVLGSVAIGIHLLLAFLLTLNVRSGPWPVPGGAMQVDSPRFASTIGDNWLIAWYQNSVRCSHSFSFASIRQEQ